MSQPEVTTPDNGFLRNKVPCNGCVACCQRERVILSPEHGDDPDSYETVPATQNEGNQYLGQNRRMLKHQPNGDCWYLRDGGCSIWHRAPAACRAFDCRRWFMRFTDRERKELLEKAVIDHKVVQAAYERIPKLIVPK